MYARSFSRRKLLHRAVATGAGAALIACGQNDSKHPSIGLAPLPPTSSAIPDVPPGRVLSGTVVVRYADELGKKPPYIEQAAAAIRQAHPNATVTIEKEQVTASEFYPRLAESLKAGAGPDVIHIAGDRIGELADAGYIAPLDQFVQSWPDWQYYPPTVIAGVTYQSQVWAVPYGLDARFLFYRRDLFEQAGLPADWQPRNVEDMLTAALQLKRRVPGVIPYSLYAGQAGDAGSANHGLVPLLRAYGGDLQDRTGAWIGDSPALRKALGYYHRAYLIDQTVPRDLLTATRPWVSMREKLGNGGLAMLFEGGWVYGGWAAKDRAGTEKNIGYLLHPTETEGPSFTIGGPGTCWFISSTCANKELAWEFITAFNNRETVGRLNWEDPHPVARADSVRLPEYRADKYLVDSTESLRRAYFTPVDVAWGKVMVAIQQMTGAVASGELSPALAASRYTDDLRQIAGPSRVVTVG